MVTLSDFNGAWLLQRGYRTGSALGAALSCGRTLLADGPLAEEGFLALLLEACPFEPVLIKRRTVPAPCAEAITATCEVDRENITKVRQLMGQLLTIPVIESGAIMPDACPAGVAEACIPVGGVIVARNAIIPAAHSADLCCSMYATFFDSPHPTDALMDVLEGSTRFGKGGRRPEDQVDHPVIHEDVWNNKFLRGLQMYAIKHMADQGDGNHFAYIGLMEVTERLLTSLRDAGYDRLHHALAGRTEVQVLVTHHGSRGLGAQVYSDGLDAAIKQTRRIAENIPPNGAWLDATSEDGLAYWEAIQYVSRWTRANHQAIHARFLAKSGATEIAAFGNEHNFLWKRGDLFYHGKGATPAWKDGSGRPLLGLVPLNMGADILVVLGGDNAAYHSFAPHGAGRNISRSATAKTFKTDDGEIEPTLVRKAIEAATPGLDIRWYSKVPDVTESPIGYKPAAQVKEQITAFGLAIIIGEINPRGCIMAGAFPNLRDKNRLTKKQVRQIGHRSERRAVSQQLKSGGFPDDDGLSQEQE
jgi:tRNA-splicing ligase RtcB